MRFNPETMGAIHKRLYTHSQLTPSKEWNVPHMLGGDVSVNVFINTPQEVELTQNVEFQVIQTTNNNLIIKFTDQMLHVGAVQCLLQNKIIETSEPSQTQTKITSNQISLLSKQSTNECLVRLEIDIDIQYIKAVKSGRVSFNTTSWNVYSFDVSDIQHPKDNFSFFVTGTYFNDDVLIIDPTSITFGPVPQYYLCYRLDTIANTQIVSSAEFFVNSFDVFVYSEKIINLQLPIRKS